MGQSPPTVTAANKARRAYGNHLRRRGTKRVTDRQRRCPTWRVVSGVLAGGPKREGSDRKLASGTTNCKGPCSLIQVGSGSMKRSARSSSTRVLSRGRRHCRRGEKRLVPDLAHRALSSIWRAFRVFAVSPASLPLATAPLHEHALATRSLLEAERADVSEAGVDSNDSSTQTE